MTRLFIAEKPSVARAIVACLPGEKLVEKNYTTVGNDVVTCLFGHVLEPAEPEDYDPKYQRWEFDHLPIIPEQWKLLPKQDRIGRVQVIKKLLKSADTVINAGDCDREGQLLVDELLEYHGNNRPVLRIWLSALDPASVTKALACLDDNRKYAGLKNSAEARQRADWLYGMNLSRAYTLAGKQSGFDGVISVGRVQTPTLALVVERDRAIETFRPKDFFSVVASLNSSEGTFKARWHPNETVTVDDDGRVLDCAVASAVAHKIENQTGTVVSCVAQNKVQPPPLPYCLNTLQAEANQRFGFSAQKVLDIAQELYEAQLTTYPRSDCKYLPESQLADAPSILESLAQASAFARLALSADTTLRSAAWNTSKVSAHHAIIPTGKPSNLEEGSPAAKIYDMIVRAYIMQFLPPHLFRVVKLTINIAEETFEASGKKTQAEGWLIAKSAEHDDDGVEDDDLPQTLPELSAEAKILCAASELISKKTTPPSHFTEGTLIAAMVNIHRFVKDPEIKKRLRETAGIGTEPTRAGIIETLKDRQFVRVKGKYIISMDTGRSLIDALPPPLKSPGLTALFEQGLQKIAEGELTPTDFVTHQADFVGKYVEKAKTAILKLPTTPCPTCKDGHLRRLNGRSGYFWGCSRYAEGCKATYPDKNGKPEFSGKTSSASKRRKTRRPRPEKD